MKSIATLVVDYQSKGTLYLARYINADSLDDGESIELPFLEKKEATFTILTSKDDQIFLKKIALSGHAGLPSRRVIRKQLNDILASGWNIVSTDGFFHLYGYSPSMTSRLRAKLARKVIPTSQTFCFMSN